MAEDHSLAYSRSVAREAVENKRMLSDKVGHSNCIILRDSCKLPDLHFPL